MHNCTYNTNKYLGSHWELPNSNKHCTARESEPVPEQNMRYNIIFEYCVSFWHCSNLKFLSISQLNVILDPVSNIYIVSRKCSNATNEIFFS